MELHLYGGTCMLIEVVACLRIAFTAALGRDELERSGDPESGLADELAASTTTPTSRTAYYGTVVRAATQARPCARTKAPRRVRPTLMVTFRDAAGNLAIPRPSIVCLRR